MELLLMLTYGAICYAIFRIFRVPVNKWTIPTAVLGGAILIFFILLIMNYNHPFTKEARLYFYTTPIVPVVKGLVTEVPVQPNVPIKKGDVLFKIDPKPYEYKVTQKQAALAEAEQSVKQSKAALESATASVAEARASRDRTKQAFERYNQGNANSRAGGRPLPFSELEVENRRGVFLAAEASFAASQANEERARLAYESQINGVNTTVARIQAELLDAQYDLDQAVVRAPTDGYVTQLFLKPGMIAVPLPLRPVMVFIHSDDHVFAAAFQQNALQRVRVGDEAEIAFDAIPGRIFKGRVKGILDAVAQGQLQATGSLIDPEERSKTSGRALTTIEIIDDLSAFQLPAGSTALVATYTEYWHHFAIIRRILLRMKSWLNYVFTEGH